jgi:hypothetical protein
MKRFLCALFLLASQQTFSQTFFSLQYEVAEPTEGFRSIAATGFGVKGTYMRFVSSRFALVGSAGYVKWGPRVDFPPNNEYKFVSIPIQLGADVLLSKGIIAPYVGMSLGMDYIRVRGIAPNSTVYSDISELKFSFRPHVGLGIFVAGPVGVNLTGSYNVIYTDGNPSKYFGLNAGLTVGF